MSKKNVPVDFQTFSSAISRIVAGTFAFDLNLRVSERSKFGEPVWDLRQGNPDRLALYSDGDLQINWGAKTIGATTAQCELHRFRTFIPLLPEAIICDVKRAVLLYKDFPSFLVRRGSTKVRHPYTIVRLAELFCNFLGWIRIDMTNHGLQPPSSLGDIALSDLRRAIKSYPYSLPEAQKYLWILANENVKKNYKHATPEWTERDLLQLEWPKKASTVSYETLPTALFKLCSTGAIDTVARFLHFAQLPVCDPKSRFAHSWEYDYKIRQIPAMIDAYTLCRRNSSVNRGDGYAYRIFKDNYGWTPGGFGDYLSRVQIAAQLVILLYTGMRSSDCRTIKVGCLTERDGHWLIRATHVKGGKLFESSGEDEWPAIDCVRDAVTALERLAKVIQNRALFAPFFNRARDAKAHGKIEATQFIDNPLSSSSLNWRIAGFIKHIDKAKMWSGWKPHTHQFRHGLALQLARAEVGLPYITRQLKHKGSLLSTRSYKVNPTTPIYGMYRDRLLVTTAGASAYQAASLEIVADMYGEGRRFAGGGAARHQRRVEEFFRGTGLEGKDRENYIEKLAANGIPLVRTGIGYCTRNHSKPTALKEDPPACIGDLKCNPHTCPHSVVPEAQGPTLLKHLGSIEKNLADTKMIHLRPVYEKQKVAIEAMLGQLHVPLPHAAVKEEP